ncbi:hypothetical protein QEN19_001424 [Hanseniaspora menglaensis]
MSVKNQKEKTVSIAPLVLLSVLDHFKRSKISSKERVVGVLLGDNTKSEKIIEITNSFAVPFKEDTNNTNSDIWFINQQFIEEMITMTKKINAKERIVGWYHSGPKLKNNDLKMNNSIFTKYVKDPVLCVIDVSSLGKQSNSSINSGSSNDGLPLKSYICVENVKEDGSVIEKNFQYVSTIIEAEEAEEIGVEHLLRDIKDSGESELSKKLKIQLESLKTLKNKIEHIEQYLTSLIEGKMPINHQILGKLQDVFNLLPNLTPELENESNKLRTAITTNTNDQMMMIHITQLVKAIIAFDDLIENKIANKNLKLSKLAKQDKLNEAASEQTISA